VRHKRPRIRANDVLRPRDARHLEGRGAGRAARDDPDAGYLRGSLRASAPRAASRAT